MKPISDLSRIWRLVESRRASLSSARRGRGRPDPLADGRPIIMAQPVQPSTPEQLHRLAERRARLLAERRKIDRQLADIDAAETAAAGRRRPVVLVGVAAL
jgi:hypothetical protein